MSKYTTQIRFLVEMFSPSGGTPSQRCTEASKTIFDFDFPIWLEEYRPIFERKILLHNYTKEISYETFGLWKMHLEERLNLIMPYYNSLYETTVKDYDYMTDVKSKESETADFTGTGSTVNTSTAKVQDSGNTISDQNSSSNDKTLSSDLPQANYSGVDYGTNLTEGEDSNTLHSQVDKTNIVDTNQNSNSDLTQKSNNTIIKTKEGAFGGRSLTDLLMQYRDSLINIDQMILDELSDLFMRIF